MAKVTLKGNEINTLGNLPEVGNEMPKFSLTKNDLSVLSNSDLNGKRVVYNIFPSIDTGTCAVSTRRFNEEAAALENTSVVCVSRDLPFAQKRFCGAEGIDNVIMASDYKNGDFGKDLGVIFIDGPLSALLSRSVVVTDENGKVLFTEQVAETANEPNYEAALAVLK